MAKKKNSSLKKKLSKFSFSKTRTICFVILTIIICSCGFAFKLPIENYFNVGLSATELSIDKNGMSVHFVDVGQGDAVVVEFPDNKTMLIDSGKAKAENALISYIDNNIFSGVSNKVFDYVVLTHADDDHSGNMSKIYEKYQVNCSYKPPLAHDNLIASNNKKIIENEPYKSVVEAMNSEPDSQVIISESGINIDGGSGETAYSIDFYGPYNDYDNTNDFSPIIVLTYKNKTVFLSGDAGTDAERDVVDNFALPQIDIYKMGHHGSSSSSTQRLLDEIQPNYAVACVGTNSYGHPNQNAIDRLTAVGVISSNFYTTQNNGNILFNVRTDGNLAIFSNVKNKAVYIYVEYLILITLIFLFNICFLKIGKKAI